MTRRYPTASKIPLIWIDPCKSRSDPNWKSELKTQWSKIQTTRTKSSRPKSASACLRRAVTLLSVYFPPHQKAQIIPGQPFDSHLLALSKLFRKSRKTFIQNGGSYRPALNSSPRTLSSSSLLESTIDYSPIEREYIWAATNQLEQKNETHIFNIRNFASNLFHEQNHRILWEFIPSSPLKKEDVRKYLNFSESLVIALDMALSDELGPDLGSLFHLCGVTYDPGTDSRQVTQNRRNYRNYLHACTYGTYLNLEGYQPKEIHHVLERLFPQLGELVQSAAQRSLQLDSEFVEKTNPFWQTQHWKAAANRLQRSGNSPLQLSENPLDNTLAYLWTENWLSTMGL